MSVVYVTKRFKFDAAHYLNNYDGKCANMHGHTWYFNVTIAGEVDINTGMLLDFNIIKSVVESTIINDLDHKVLNEVLCFNPTAENLVRFIYTKLREEFFKVEGHTMFVVTGIKLWENYPESFVEYYGG